MEKKNEGAKNDTSYLIRLFRGSGDDIIHVKCSLQSIRIGNSIKLAMMVMRRRRARNLL